MRSEPVQFEGRAIPFTVSIGLAQFDSGCAAVTELIARADGALYNAKYGGRDRVHAHGKSPAVENAAPPTSAFSVR